MLITRKLIAIMATGLLFTLPVDMYAQGRGGGDRGDGDRGGHERGGAPNRGGGDRGGAPNRGPARGNGAQHNNSGPRYQNQRDPQVNRGGGYARNEQRGPGHGGFDRRDNRNYAPSMRGSHYGRPYHGPAPRWANSHRYSYDRHVYFPDYYTYYDPYRGGYTYYAGNRWMFSQNLPRFLMNVNLGSARVQYIGDIPLTTRPERYYQRYARQYPSTIRINAVIRPPLPW